MAEAHADAGNGTKVTIERLGAQGDGIAGAKDAATFMPFALPGETWARTAASARASGAQSWQMTGAPSPDRVAPPCRHFGTCGGCVAQHMSQRLYAEWKRDIVIDAFRHRGIEADVDALVTIAGHSRRRASLTAVRRNGEVVLGYHARASHDVIDIEACPVLTPRIEAALAPLRNICAMLMPAHDGSTLRVTVTEAQRGLDVSIEGAGARAARVGVEAAKIAQQAGAGRLLVDGEPLLAGMSPVASLGGVDVAMPDTAFLQAVAEAEAHMRRLVVEGAGAKLPKKARIADLFCGLGTFAFALATRASVLAIDGDKPAIDALSDAVRHAQGRKPIEARRRDLFRDPLSERELSAFDAVVLDPPRAGAAAQVAKLAASKVPRIVMVSCNPATLARDVRALLDGGYQLSGRVTPIDQFLYSAHVEAVAVLTR